MYTPESKKIPAEELLVNEGLINRRSEQRRKVIGCIACRWNDLRSDGLDPAIYGRQIIECTGIKPGVVYPLLSKLEESGVITSQQEDIDPTELGRPPRKLYQPQETDVGVEFDNALEPPTHCSLDVELQ